MSGSFNLTDIKKEAVFEFLGQNRIYKTDAEYKEKTTHTSFGKVNGSYHIPPEKLDEFYKLYDAEFRRGGELNMIERHTEYGPIVIDFDFKFTDAYDTRLFTSEIVKDIVNAYITEIKTIWDVKDDTDLNAYVFTRPAPYFAKSGEKTITKDGLHIMFPHIVSTPDAQFYLREKVLCWMEDILKTLPLINSVDDVVDERVIEKNGWYMFGSSKPNMMAYDLVNIYDHNLNEIPVDTFMNKYDLSKFLSIRGKTADDATPIIWEVQRYLSDIKYEASMDKKEKNTKKQTYEGKNIKIDTTDDTYKNNVIQLLTLLNPTRFTEYSTWLNIVWFMRKCGFDDDAIHTVSQIGSNYSENGVNQAIRTLNPEKCILNIGTLFYYLKEDVDTQTYNSIITLFKNAKVEIVPLPDIKADENINLNNIGSYLPRLEKADVVCIRSNMMTYKTQNLKELTQHYKKIVIVSFRVSLDEAYIADFQEYGFKLYSDSKGTIRDERVVVQIDSLFKLRGAYDLLILDEFVYTSDHLVSFVKEKPFVWNALTEYIQFTPKIIVCDALLNPTSINLFRDLKRTVHVVNNEWKSFEGYTADIVLSNSELFILDIFNLLKDNKNVVVPISSISCAETLIGYINKHLPHIKIGYISQDTSIIPPNMWNEYQLLIYTPTIAAGISFNEKYFDNRHCYFSNMSCSAELATQMIFRVRNSTCKNIKICVNIKGRTDLPTEDNELDQYIQDMDELDTKTGLNISRVRNAIIKDEYYNIFKDFLKRKNLSRNNYAGVLAGILEAHGVKVTFTNNEIPECINELKTECVEIHEDNVDAKALNVCNATTITKEQAEILEEQYKKTATEKLSLRKYHILKTYGERDLTPDFVKKYEKLTPQYYNLCEFGKPNFIETIKDKIINKEVSQNNTSRLHQSNRDIKLYWVDSVIKMLGYENVFDTKHIKGFPYEMMQKHLIEHGDNIALLFNTSKKDWKSITLDKQGKKLISEYINNRLREVVNISVTNKHRGKSSKFQEYVIHGIDEWEQNDISFIEKPELKLKDLIKVDGDDGCSKLVHKDYLNMDLDCLFKNIIVV